MPASKTGKSKAFKMQHRHRLFAEAYVQGMSKKDAYLAAGFSGKYTGGPQALLARPEIRDLVAKLRVRQRYRLNVTMDTLVLDLKNGMELAIATNNASAYVQAVMGLAKLMGFLVERTEHDIYLIPKPALKPGSDVLLSPEEWSRQWAPADAQLPPRGNGHADGNGAA